MSHIVTITTKVHDPVAVSAACQRLGLPQPTQGTASLYRTQAKGLLVQLPQWQFPVVIDTESGNVKFDNFGGSWGEQQHLDRFLQAYAVEKAKIEARRQGFSVTEATLQDGSIKVQLIEGGT
jgi:hypothetical protein